jgi:hypothetical protein
LIALGFIVTINVLSGKQLLEKFTLVEDKTSVLPGCLNISKQNLLEAFDNNPDKLRSILGQINVPYNLIDRLFITTQQYNDLKTNGFTDQKIGEISEDAAPLVATYLINWGYNISSSCKLPPNADSTVIKAPNEI